jgi:hypothetical protein
MSRDETLTSIGPNHLDRILKTWNVTGQLYSSVAKSGVILIGPRRNVLLAGRHIRDAESAIVTVEVPVGHLTRSSPVRAIPTIPVQALEAIAYNTRTYIRTFAKGKAVSVQASFLCIHLLT